MAVHRAMRSCRLEDELYLKVKYIADRENRSFNNYLEALLRKVVEKYEEEHGVISVDTESLYQ